MEWFGFKLCYEDDLEVGNILDLVKLTRNIQIVISFLEISSLISKSSD